METWIIIGMVVIVLYFLSQLFFLEWEIVRDSWKERPLVGMLLLALQLAFWPYWLYRVSLAWYYYIDKKRKEA